MRERRVAAAAVLGTLAFWAYSRTLLPGVDLGDTGGFQAAVLWPFTSARRAYPLYYALATPFVGAVSAANPARGLNLFSAVWAAIAVGLLAGFVSRITRSVAAGAVAGLLLAFSYTFWTQAVIAEVYSLHLALVGVCLFALDAFAVRPTRVRLAAFFAVYALSFGNHFSMILLFVPCTVFLFQVHPRPRELVHPTTMLMAAALAAGGLLLYSANFLSVGSIVDAPVQLADRLGMFWFDTTKADWRDTMVLGVPSSQTMNRLAMWLWDARQQFGAVGVFLAAAGAVRLWWISRAWAVFIWLAYAINSLFALTYNVGDSHVFFLPGHFFTALAAGVAIAPIGDSRRQERRDLLFSRAGLAAAVIAIMYAGWRGWDTWPAADRHLDRRGEDLVTRLTVGITSQRALLVSGLNWEVENALLYAARWERADLAWARVADVLPHFPFLVRDNADIGRDIVLTREAAREIATAYGSLFPIVVDEGVATTSFGVAVSQIPRGAPYVLTSLTPPGDERVDGDDLARVMRVLVGSHPVSQGNAPYELIAGTAGDAPSLVYAADRPFRLSTSILGERFLVRMDSWIPFDSFRRGGFGHVIYGHSPVLTIERGLSLVWLDRSGLPQVRYGAGLYAAKPRFRIARLNEQLASRGPERFQPQP